MRSTQTPGLPYSSFGTGLLSEPGRATAGRRRPLEERFGAVSAGPLLGHLVTQFGHVRVVTGHQAVQHGLEIGNPPVTGRTFLLGGLAGVVSLGGQHSHLQGQVGRRLWPVRHVCGPSPPRVVG